MEAWDDPLPLYTCNDDKLLLNTTVTDKLKKINKPLVTVCIAGPYRMGKSYLMNRLAGKQTGFALGSTVEAMTKGIWVWYVDHPKDKNIGLLLMDTEGLGDPARGDDNYDMWILCLSILLSSTFIYNTFGKIDNSLIDTLNFVSDISGRIQAEMCDNSDKDFDGFFPAFVLAIRDGTLELKMRGHEVTEDEYMEKTMLALKHPETTDREKTRNNVKKKLRRYFPNRKCFYFVRPTRDERDLQRLDEIEFPQLQQKFITKSNEFCHYIFTNATVKKINRTQRVDGRIFAELAHIYLQAINRGSVPCVSTAIELVAQKENEMLLKQCVEEYRRSMSNVLTLPATMDELELAHIRCHETVVDVFLEKMFLDGEEKYREELQESLYNEYATFAVTNSEYSKFTSNEILSRLFEPVRVKIENSSYLQSNGYSMFIQDIERIEREYNSTPNKGIMADIILRTFLEQMENDQQMILNAEEVLNQQEKNIERERFLQECAERSCELSKQESQRRHQHTENLLQSYDNHMRQLYAIHLQKQEEEKIAFRHQLETREAEEKRLLEENFKEDADRLKTEMEELRTKRKNVIKKIAASIGSLAGTLLACVPHPGIAGAGMGLYLISTIVDKISIK